MWMLFFFVFSRCTYTVLRKSSFGPWAGLPGPGLGRLRPASQRERTKIRGPKLPGPKAQAMWDRIWIRSH